MTAIVHRIHPKLVDSQVAVDLAGCGGNGSQMLTGLARLHVALRALGHPGLDVTAYDPDDVSAANVGRQLFSSADVGQNKAAVLVNRINAFYGLAWSASTARYRGSMASPGDGSHADIVVTCVDSAKARVQIGDGLDGCHGLYYWLDLGNRAHDGQVVLGCPVWDDEHRERYPERLPTVLELFPELRTIKREDNAPSCSLAESLDRQSLFINQAVVTSALQLLWQIFRHGETTWHGSFVNLSTGRTTPLPVDPNVWARMRGEKNREEVAHQPQGDQP